MYQIRFDIASLTFGDLQSQRGHSSYLLDLLLLLHSQLYFVVSFKMILATLKRDYLLLILVDHSLPSLKLGLEGFHLGLDATFHHLFSILEFRN